MHGIQLRFPSLTGNQPLFPGYPVGAITVGTTNMPHLFRSFSFIFGISIYEIIIITIINNFMK